MVRGGHTAASKQVLVVEARLHERETLQPVLSASGYKTFTVGSADEAFALVEQGLKADAVVIGSGLGVSEMGSLVDRLKRKMARPEMPVVLIGDPARHETNRDERLGHAMAVPRGNRTMLLATLAEAFAQAASVKALNMELAA
jgi:CheY-like chemotaxis protein